MHVTPSASNLYMEINWLWTADHDLDAAYTNITIYSGRGLFIESGKGNIWLVGTSVEHHALYRYQPANTQIIFAGQIQTETAYYQPHPDINAPFNAVPRLNDPTAKGGCKNGTNCDGLGLRVLDSQNVNIYGAGLYSFFDDYNTCEQQTKPHIPVGEYDELMRATACSYPVSGEICQRSIFSIEGKRSSNVNVYNLNTIGATSMIDREGVSLARFKDNVDVFPDDVAIFRLD